MQSRKKRGKVLKGNSEIYKNNKILIFFYYFSFNVLGYDANFIKYSFILILALTKLKKNNFLDLCNLVQDSCRIPGAYLLKLIHQLPAGEVNFDNVSEN